MVVGFSEVLDWFSKLGGFAGLWAAWRIYRDGIPQVRSELRPKLYSKTHPDQMDLILRFYPGSRPVTIHSIELPEFDISIVTPRRAGFPMRALGGGRCGFSKYGRTSDLRGRTRSADLPQLQSRRSPRRSR